MKAKLEGTYREEAVDSDGLLTLSDIARATRIPIIELMRYSVQHASLIPSDGAISRQRRYPPSAVDVFRAIKNRPAGPSLAKGSLRRIVTSGPTPTARSQAARASEMPSEEPRGRLYRLAEISEILGISLEDLTRYDAMYDDRIPAEATGERKRYPECALPVFEAIREEDIESRLPATEEHDLAVFELVSPELWHALSTNPELLRSLHWRDFEKVLAGLLEKMEYEIELRRGTKDGGVDIFAIKRVSPFGLHRYLLQAKRSSNAVGVEPIRQLMFLHSEHRVSKSCLATTSRFTRGAYSIADSYLWQLELRDFGKLKEWVQQALCIQRIEGAQPSACTRTAGFAIRR